MVAPSAGIDPIRWRELVAAAPEGVAVLDAERRCHYLNEAGARLLGTSTDDPAASALIQLAGDRLQVLEWPLSVGPEGCVAVSFRQADRHDRQQRKVAAFARTAARVALIGPVEEVLDRVAEEAREATGARACSIILRNREGFDAQLVGIAGHEDSYLPRLLAELGQGAPLATLEAFQTGRPARRSHLQELIHDEPAYGTLVESAEAAGWTDLVAVPMVVQEETLGVLTSFFGTEQSPSDDDVAFLLAMADQCGVAVHNSRLFNEVQAAAAVEQRHRWAHDLHDSVSQSLFSLVLQARALRLAARRSDGSGLGEIAQGLERLEELAEGMQAEMRALMTELGPGVNRDPLLTAVSELAKEIREQTGLEVVLDLPAGEPELTDLVRSEVFRVVREAVHNSVRHAAATRLSVAVHTRASGELIVEVTDDGCGFDASRPNPGHLGLWSMRERAERLGGTCSVTSTPGDTKVQITVPSRHRPDGSR